MSITDEVKTTSGFSPIEVRTVKTAQELKSGGKVNQERRYNYFRFCENGFGGPKRTYWSGYS